MMATPINEATSNWPVTTAAAEKQRLDRVLQQLPAVRQSEAQREIKKDELVKPVQQINEVMNNYGIHFEFDDSSGRTIVKVVSQESGEVIRQIPNEEVLRIAQHLHEMSGLLVREEA
ncbi:flagellar protein [Pseudidiomarina tainanensis]|uniref:Flagellar protein n=1 Tax=Pseudidiomarina tainanensis TaxID=502365 RepID=A0ACD2HHE2_9GAMM|nr:flagellar protein FlaG [Pseudidiomarina tainanensis]RZQ55826.1 flagellar protein [Pseudidiomarina tainanensis]